MKIPCPEHGVHFGDEIVEIVACDLVWQRWNLDKLPYPSRKELIEWYVEIPADKIFIETGWGVGCGLFGEYIGYDNALAQDDAYKSMSEPERRAWQKADLKRQYEAAQKRGIRKWVNKLKRK